MLAHDPLASLQADCPHSDSPDHCRKYLERFLNEFEVALHTGMRRADLKRKRIHLLKAKNGSGRIIPLNSAKLATFERQFQVSGHAEMDFLADDEKPVPFKAVKRPCGWRRPLKTGSERRLHARRQRQREVEGRALSERAFRPDASAVGHDNMLDDGQAEAGAAGLA